MLSRAGVVVLFAVTIHARPQPAIGRYPSTQPFINVSSTADGAGLPVLESFISYSIELCFWPDYAGNSSQPNNFSYNLLSNIANEQGTRPYLRIGGNTQDIANFNPALQQATNGTYTSASKDYPSILDIGPSFFDSYSTLDTKYGHGFNLEHGNAQQRQALLDSVPFACKALDGGRLAYWEFGNEPGLYAQDPAGSSTWNEPTYVNEWSEWTQQIRDKLAASCPDMVNSSMWIAPSLSGLSSTLDPVKVFQNGLANDHDISLISIHNYIADAQTPGITLAHSLLNHTLTAASIAAQAHGLQNLAALPQSHGIPYILGETNSLFHQGAPGLSNSFGAALWAFDYALLAASSSIGRLHFHQGTDYRYAAWQPVGTNRTALGTKPPYYGNVAAAAMVGSATAGATVQVQAVAGNMSSAAYAAYDAGRLARLAAVNLVEYNYTAPDGSPSSELRPTGAFWFALPPGCAGVATVRRLCANGSDAVTGVAWAGASFNIELNEGRPVVMANVSQGETVQVGADGLLGLDVPASSAAVVTLSCE